jgi:preprotein translocase subunit YajC
MQMESLANFDLEMYPDLVDMLDGVSVGDKVRISGGFVVKELSDKRLTASFDDNDSSVTITKVGGEEEDDEAESEADSDEEEAEESAG